MKAIISTSVKNEIQEMSFLKSYKFEEQDLYKTVFKTNDFLLLLQIKQMFTSNFYVTKITDNNNIFTLQILIK